MYGLFKFCFKKKRVFELSFEVFFWEVEVFKIFFEVFEVFFWFGVLRVFRVCKFSSFEVF